MAETVTLYLVDTLQIFWSLAVIGSLFAIPFILTREGN
jgi:hypothetical protein